MQSSLTSPACIGGFFVLPEPNADLHQCRLCERILPIDQTEHTSKQAAIKLKQMSFPGLSR